MLITNIYIVKGNERKQAVTELVQIQALTHKKNRTADYHTHRYTPVHESTAESL